MPYDYLLQIDDIANIDLANCIIIFDEGHNIISKSEEGYSLELSNIILK